MGDQRPERSQAVAAPRLAVLTGAEAVAHTARILVGDAVARDPAVAEGLAEMPRQPRRAQPSLTSFQQPRARG